MTYSISCVLIIPATMRDMANGVIEGYGFGPNNMSVQLVKTADQSSWYGSHIWCDQAFSDFIQSRQAIDFMGTMVISTNSGPANAHWQQVLNVNGLKLPDEL